MYFIIYDDAAIRLFSSTPISTPMIDARQVSSHAFITTFGHEAHDYY